MGLFREAGRRIEQFKRDATEAADETTDDADDDPDPEVERAEGDESRSESDGDDVDAA